MLRFSPYGGGAANGPAIIEPKPKLSFGKAVPPPRPAWVQAPQAQAASAAPNDNLYLTGLPEEVGLEMLKDIFSMYGAVVQARILNNPRGAGRNAALVRFSSTEQAEAALNAINANGGIPVGLTEPLQIQFAEPSRPKGQVVAPPSAGGPPPQNGQTWSDGIMDQALKGFESSGFLPGGTGYHNDAGCIYICGLPSDCTDLHLYRLFACFGPIAPRGVKVMLLPDGSCKGYGFVNFQAEESAQAAIIAINGKLLPDGQLLTVKIKAPPKSSGGQAWRQKEDGE